MCSAASPEVKVPDVKVTKSARNEKRRSIGNDSDLDPLCTGPATTTTTATVTVTTTADNSHSDSDSRSTSRMAGGHHQSIGNSGGGGANHNNSDTASPFSTLSPIRQHHSRHSRQASDLAAEMGTNCFPNQARTSSILSLQPQQTATSLDTDAARMADKDGCRRTHHHAFPLAAADENSAPFTLTQARPSSPPLPRSPPPLSGAPSPRLRHYLQANRTSPQLDSPRHLEKLPAISLGPASSHLHSAVDDSPYCRQPFYRVHPAAIELPLLTTMSCVTPSVAAPAASIVAPASSTLGVGSIFAASPACNPSLSAPSRASLNSPPLASAQSISQLYSTKLPLPSGTTIASPTLLRPPLQLFVANIAEGSRDKAATDLGGGHIGQVIDIDIDMGGDLHAGSEQDSDVGSDDHARPSVSQVMSGVSRASGSSKQDRYAASSRAIADSTGSGGRQQPLHGHSLSESQISPIRSLTALALSQSRSPSQSPRLGRSSIAGTHTLRPLLDASAQQELLLKVEDIQRYCDSLRQVQAQQASKIRSLEATVRRFSDVTSPSSTHQHTPAATTATGSAAAQLVSAAISPPPPLPSSSIDERMALHYHQHHHQRVMMPPAFEPLTSSSSAAAAGGSRPIPHLPPVQAPMASLSSTPIHRSSDVMAEGPQYSHQPQPAVAYQQSHSAAAGVASERRAAAQMSAGMEQQHGAQQQPLTAPQHSHHHSYSQQMSTQPSPTGFASRFPAPTQGHQQAYRPTLSDQFSPKMARQASPPSLAAVGGSHGHHRSLGAGSRSQLHQHSYQRPGGSVGRSRRGSAAMPAPYAMSSGHGDERDTRLPHHHQQQHQPQRPFQVLPPPPLPLSSSSSSRRASAGPSAFGYPAVAASAMPAPFGSATTPADFAPRSAGGDGGGQGGTFPVMASGHPSMRMKRPRDAESGDEFADAHVSGANDAAGDATLPHTPSRAYSMHHPAQSRHHSSHHHAVLPPIRISDSSQQATPSGSARTAATSFGGNVGGSLHLVQPSAIAYSHSGLVAGDYGGAVDVPAFSGSEQPARGNRDAQPTHAWLASQRQYKTALLHLLSLESFYPSDMAMLNMFRSMGDFTADQVEIHGATLLSWARGWLR
ncbi:hypothetical protein GGH13_008013, partial [Coemansia sp. S155-1]